jgi:hypothetical protein
MKLGRYIKPRLLGASDMALKVSCSVRYQCVKENTECSCSFDAALPGVQVAAKDTEGPSAQHQPVCRSFVLCRHTTHAERGQFTLEYIKCEVSSVSSLTGGTGRLMDDTVWGGGICPEGFEACAHLHMSQARLA